MADAVTPTGLTPPGPAPRLPSAPKYHNNQCNGYLPNSSVRDRLIWVAKFYAKNGFYVMVDNHLREDQTALENADSWAEQWADLAKDMSTDPTLKSKLIIDLLNEPDNYEIKWSKLTELYIIAMDAISASTKDSRLLFAIEGTGQV